MNDRELYTDITREENRRIDPPNDNCGSNVWYYANGEYHNRETGECMSRVEFLYKD